MMREQRVSDRACIVAVTVNLQGTTVERRAIDEDLLYGRNSYGKYMAAVGCARLLDMLARRDIPATFFTPGAEAERHPALVRDIVSAGHEIASHGYAMEELDAPGIDEATLLRRADAALRDITGKPVRGFRAPHGRLSKATLGHLAALEYSYDASFQDDDMPYRLDSDGGAGMIEVPQSEILIDGTLYHLRKSHDRVMQTWREEFAAMHAERCMITLTLHPRSDYGSGRASRVAALDEFLRWAAALPDVVFMTCGDIADGAAAGDLRCRA